MTACSCSTTTTASSWLVDKLAGMVGTVFRPDPLVSTYGGWGRAAVIMDGPRLATLPPGRVRPVSRERTRQPATCGDRRGLLSRADAPSPPPTTGPSSTWPSKAFPSIYIAGLAMVAS